MKKLLLSALILAASTSANATGSSSGGINIPNFAPISNGYDIRAKKIANGWEVNADGVINAYTGTDNTTAANAAAKAAIDNDIK